MFARPSGARICNECVASFAHELALRQQAGKESPLATAG